MAKKTTKSTKKSTLSAATMRAGKTYAEAIAEACDDLGIGYHEALVDTDDHPKLCKEWMIEFSIGWFHGAADVLELEVTALWDAIHAELGAKAKRAA